MNELFAGWSLVVRRLLSGWRLLLVTTIGVVVAATLLAVSPIYAETMSNLGLRFRLERNLDEDELGVVEVRGLMLGDAVARQRRAAIDEIAEARIGWLADEVLVEERTERMVLSFPAYPLVRDQFQEVLAQATGARTQPAGRTSETVYDEPRFEWGAFIYAIPGYEQHVTVTEGRLPGPGDGPAEVVLLDGFQRHAAVGDQIRLETGRYDDCVRVDSSDDPEIAAQEVRCRPTTLISTTAVLTIVGFVAPNDPDDPRWQIFRGRFAVPDEPLLARLPPSEDDNTEVGFVVRQAMDGVGSIPLLTSTEQLFGAIALRMPQTSASHIVGVILDIDALSLSDVPRAIEDIHGVRTDIGDRLDLVVLQHFRMARELERFRNTQSFSQIPLLLILLQVVGIVLYYVMMVMAMLLDRQSEEMSIFRSRGASTAQIVGLYLMEGLVLAVPAAFVGPWLAGWAISLLGLSSTFAAISGGSLLAVSVTPEAYLLSAAGAATALLAMLIPSFLAARRGIVDVKREQARPGEQSAIQRYYLDFGVVVLAALLLWQLDQRGSVFDPDSIGGWSADPLLLLSPLAITAAVAALVLRFYPPLLRLTVRLLLTVGGTSVAIGLRRAGRSPGTYARLMLLLLMAISVGTFAASYGPTVDRSLQERARYESGADLRAALSDDDDRSAPARVADVRTLPGVVDAAVAHRGTTRGLVGPVLPMLAIDTQRAAEMLWFRDDFTETTPRQLVAVLEGPVPSGSGGIVLPDDAVTLEVPVFVRGDPQRPLIKARFRDANGRYSSVTLSAVEFRDEWVVARAAVPVEFVAPRPVKFMGFIISDRLGTNLRITGDLFFDDIAAVSAVGRREVIEDFDGSLRWSIFTQAAIEESIELSGDRSLSGGQALRWQWPRTISPRQRVIAVNDPNVPVAAIVSERAAGVLGAELGGVVELQLGAIRFPISVRAIVDLFPTLDPEAGFIVVSIADLREIAGLFDVDAEQFANELWVDFEQSMPLADQQALIATLQAYPESPLRIVSQITHLADDLDAIAADPTLQASGGGILLLAFVAVLGLSTLGFVVTLVLGAHGRALEFAVLRAVGSSSRQILRAMLLEWGVVLLLGGAIGILLGRRVAGVMLAFLDVTEDGDVVLPPFILETDWVTLGAGLTVLTVLVLGALGWAWLSAMRRASAAQLRITQ